MHLATGLAEGLDAAYESRVRSEEEHVRLGVPSLLGRPASRLRLAAAVDGIVGEAAKRGLERVDRGAMLQELAEPTLPGLASAYPELSKSRDHGANKDTEQGSHGSKSGRPMASDSTSTSLQGDCPQPPSLSTGAKFVLGGRDRRARPWWASRWHHHSEAAMASRTAPAPHTLPAGPHPLLITRDPGLLEELLRLADAAGVEVEVAQDAHAARPRFAAAPVVLVDAACANGFLRARLPRRPGVVLVCADPAAEPPWELAEALGAEHVAVLPAAEPWLVDRLVRAVGTRYGPARVVAVLGGRGGAGASVFAAGLAVTAARSGLRAMLVDADPLGGGVDLVLGWEALDGLRWPALAADEPASLVDSLPTSGELAVLSWDRGDVFGVPVDAMAAALDAGRAGRELVVVDLPRRLDDTAALALAAADIALLLVPAELRACAAAARVAAAAPQTPSLRVVVRGPAPGRLRPREIARALGLPLAGSLRAEPDLARALERGEPPAGTGKGPLASLCQRLISELELTGGPVTA